MRLTWEKPGHLTITHRDHDTEGAVIQVPVTIDGLPPVMPFDPKYLADAFAIGATLRLVGGLNPGMDTDSAGNFCLTMNQRSVPEPITEDDACKSPPPATAGPRFSSVPIQHRPPAGPNADWWEGFDELWNSLFCYC